MNLELVQFCYLHKLMDSVHSIQKIYKLFGQMNNKHQVFFSNKVKFQEMSDYLDYVCETHTVFLTIRDRDYKRQLEIIKFQGY